MRAAKSQSTGPVRRRRGALFLPSVALDRSSHTPLHEQLRAQLSDAIDRDGIAGTRLPSTRLLAGLLGISRNTVALAYEELVSRGLIEGRPRSGMTIARTKASGPFDLQRLLREAQYPSRTISLADPDGAEIYLIVPQSRSEEPS